MAKPTRMKVRTNDIISLFFFRLLCGYMGSSLSDLSFHVSLEIFIDPILGVFSIIHACPPLGTQKSSLGGG
jgi:hypothetical protein